MGLLMHLAELLASDCSPVSTSPPLPSPSHLPPPLPSLLLSFSPLPSPPVTSQPRWLVLVGSLYQESSGPAELRGLFRLPMADMDRTALWVTPFAHTGLTLFTEERQAGVCGSESSWPTAFLVYPVSSLAPPSLFFKFMEDRRQRGRRGAWCSNHNILSHPFKAYGHFTMHCI